MDHVSMGVHKKESQQQGRAVVGFFMGVWCRLSTVREFIEFLGANKLWWMIPMILLLLAVGALVVFIQSSPVGPFIYTLF